MMTANPFADLLKGVRASQGQRKFEFFVGADREQVLNGAAERLAARSPSGAASDWAERNFHRFPDPSFVVFVGPLDPARSKVPYALRFAVTVASVPIAAAVQVDDWPAGIPEAQ